MKETFVGEAITPEDTSFASSPMATGAPGLPREFSWKGRKYSVLQVLEEWKETGDCRHGSGERYVRKHWYRVKTAEGPEMKIYFERQGRADHGARWRLYSLRTAEAGISTTDAAATSSTDLAPPGVTPSASASPSP